MIGPLGTLLLVLPCSLALASSFPSTSLHTYMSPHELNFYFGEEKPQDYELVHISTQHPLITKRSGHDEPSVVRFEALGDDYTLYLKPNRKLLAPYAVVGKRNGNSTVNFESSGDAPQNFTGEKAVPVVDWLDLTDQDYIHITGHEEDHKDRDMSMDELWMDRSNNKDDECQYLHKGDGMVAAMSLCDGKAHGFVMSDNHTLEVLPLNNRLKRMLNMWQEDYNQTLNGTIRTREPREYHIVKRSRRPSTRPYLDHVKELFADQDNSEEDEVEFDKRSNKKRNYGSEQVIETALFLDSAAYQRFSRYFNSMGEDSEREIRRLLLGYMNGIQAIYMLPSLRHNIRFSIVRMEMWQQNPSGFYHYQGDREPMLNSFCEYQAKLNSGSDSSPGYWDLALYVSGLNFYAMDNTGKMNGVTMGLARVGGICHKDHACVVGELGVTTSTGKPYPSAGFTAVYVMAHEIGHNLGMSHDHTAGCAMNGYIMSASRGTKGESQWSSCSVNSLDRHIADGSLSCLQDDNANEAAKLGMSSDTFPGEVWDANSQCQIFLLDPDAHIDHNDADFQDMCYSIKCRTPKREGYYRAGPALEGTACGQGKWCRHGECVTNNKPQKQDEPGIWSDWSYSTCQSGCLPNSLGYKTKKRTCQRGRLIHTLAGCRGPTTGMDFCPDDNICPVRKEIDRYASEQCAIFSSYVPGIDSKGIGVQVQYSSTRLWQSCAIYCKRSDTGQWYTPRIDLNDLPISPYFPDGTFCHQDGDTKYYCQKNTCLERDSRVAKNDSPDLDILFNASPEGNGERKTPKEIEDYFTLDEQMKSVGGNYGGVSKDEDKESLWDVIDYVE